MSIRENVVNMAEKVTGKDLDGDLGMRSYPVSKQKGTSCPAFRNPAFTMPEYPKPKRSMKLEWEVPPPPSEAEKQEEAMKKEKAAAEKKKKEAAASS
mmetsp:Transcript_7230/g.17993  ORF Transcript_7230/g.17993 Transcript_7230/m.17993 type:complete len:97 (+) Transcript_7230:164-454(+)